MNDVFWAVACIVFFLLGYCVSMSFWYERAEKGSLIETRGEIYKLEKQTVLEE